MQLHSSNIYILREFTISLDFACFTHIEYLSILRLREIISKCIYASNGIKIHVSFDELAK